MIMQMPEEMTLLAPDKDGKFVYLMQFTDGNRIDLTLVPVERADEFIYNDSLSVLLLDKDGVVKPFPPASDKDYIIKKPSKKEFDDCCNEFWWVCPYVAKGIWREELPYAKHILEQNLRDMLMKMLEWDIGIRTNFTKSAGKFGKYFKKYLDADTWKEFLETYSDADYENMWKSLFAMCNLFRKTAIRVADYFGFQYPYGDDERVTAHLKHVKYLPKDAEKMY